MRKTLILSVLLLAALTLQAETIRLSNGMSFEGEIISRDESYVTVRIPAQALASGTILEKPVKKTAMVEGNFEIVQGSSILAPIDTNAIHKAALQALTGRGYIIINDSPGVITYKLEKRSYDLTMRFCYYLDEYWYEYVDSTNLDADPRKNKIHGKYFSWIKNLEKDIPSLYYSNLGS